MRHGQDELGGDLRLLGAETLAASSRMHGGGKIRIHARYKLGTVERSRYPCAPGRCVHRRDAIGQDLLEGHHGRVARYQSAAPAQPFDALSPAGSLMRHPGTACLGEQASMRCFPACTVFACSISIQRDNGIAANCSHRQRALGVSVGE
jgi:hypothetical protein